MININIAIRFVIINVIPYTYTILVSVGVVYLNIIYVMTKGKIKEVNRYDITHKILYIPFDKHIIIIIMLILQVLLVRVKFTVVLKRFEI